MNIIKAIKQIKEVADLQEENELLYDEKTYYSVQLETVRDEYRIADKRCKQYYKLFNEIKDIVNENQNGSVLNLQNRIKTKLEELKI